MPTSLQRGDLPRKPNSLKFISASVHQVPSLVSLYMQVEGARTKAEMWLPRLPKLVSPISLQVADMPNGTFVCLDRAYHARDDPVKIRLRHRRRSAVALILHDLANYCCELFEEQT